MTNQWIGSDNHILTCPSPIEADNSSRTNEENTYNSRMNEKTSYTFKLWVVLVPPKNQKLQRDLLNSTALL